jgi:hypothetical protein
MKHFPRQNKAIVGLFKTCYKPLRAISMADGITIAFANASSPVPENAGAEFC